MRVPSKNHSAGFRALVVDLDGTLLDDRAKLRGETRDALRGLAERGVRVVVATGRSEAGAQPILDELELDGPAMVYNGAGLWCPRQRVFLEERTLADPVRDEAVDFGLEHEALVVTMHAGGKVTLAPTDASQQAVLKGIEQLRLVDRDELYLERALRVMIASDAWPSSTHLASALSRRIERPIYLAHFPLAVLAHLRGNPLLVCDVQAPCRGKAEALRWLSEEHAIDADEVVCVGDASNDLEMLAKAGLAVAMGNAMPQVRAVADRVIGDNNGTAIAELCRELWP